MTQAGMEWVAAAAEARSDAGVVAAGHPAAAAAGAEVLRRGNAVDALVAAAFASFVVEPHNCGVAGYGRLAAYDPIQDAFLCVDHHLRAPASAGPRSFAPDDGAAPLYYGHPPAVGGRNQRGPLSVGVPGAVAGLCAAHERLGSLPLAEVVDPAVQLAEAGLPVDWELALAVAEAAESVRANRAAQALLEPGGVPPKLFAEPLVLDLRRLADVLRRIGREGPGGFYAGPVAAWVGAQMRELGGLIDEEDLAGYVPKVFVERSAHALGHDFVTADDAVAYEALGLLESLDFAVDGPDGVAFRHAMAEALGCAFTDSLRHYGDPDYVAAPADGLRDHRFHAARATSLSLDRALARPIQPGDPWPFDPRTATGDDAGSVAAVRGTSQVAAADRDGRMASLCTTICSSFGSGVLVDKGAFFLNNGMQNFDPRPGRPNSIAPGKMPIFAAPAYVARDGRRAVLAVSGSGGYRIESGVLHTVVNRLAFGLDLGDAMGRPRVHCQGGETLVDARVPAAVQRRLAALGHDVRVRVERPWPVHFGRVSGVAREPDGSLVAASWPACSGGAAGA